MQVGWTHLSIRPFENLQQENVFLAMPNQSWSESNHMTLNTNRTVEWSSNRRIFLRYALPECSLPVLNKSIISIVYPELSGVQRIQLLSLFSLCDDILVEAQTILRTLWGILVDTKDRMCSGLIVYRRQNWNEHTALVSRAIRNACWSVLSVRQHLATSIKTTYYEITAYSHI